MIQLRRALAELYPRESDQRRVVTEAGLRESSIGFEASADNTWFNILQHARQVKKLDAILAYVREEHPGNEVIESAIGGAPGKRPPDTTSRVNAMTQGTVVWDFFSRACGRGHECRRGALRPAGEGPPGLPRQALAQAWR